MGGVWKRATLFAEYFREERILHCSLYILLTIHNSLIRSDEGLMLLYLFTKKIKKYPHEGALPNPALKFDPANSSPDKLKARIEYLTIVKNHSLSFINSES